MVYQILVWSKKRLFIEASTSTSTSSMCASNYPIHLFQRQLFHLSRTGEFFHTFGYRGSFFNLEHFLCGGKVWSLTTTTTTTMTTTTTTTISVTHWRIWIESFVFFFCTTSLKLPSPLFHFLSPYLCPLKKICLLLSPCFALAKFFLEDHFSLFVDKH